MEQAAGQVASRGDARAGQRARTGGAKKKSPPMRSAGVYFGFYFKNASVSFCSSVRASAEPLLEQLDLLCESRKSRLGVKLGG